MTGTKNLPLAAYIFHAYNILIFYKGTKSNIQALTSLLFNYIMALSQDFSNSKSTIFAGSMTNSRLNNMLNMTGFKKETLSFNYLGVLLFKGTVRARHLQHITDIMLVKLTTWKGTLLYIVGRTLLVQSNIHVMITHSICVYY